GADIADDPRRDADDDLASRHRHAVWKDGPGGNDAPVADAIAADQYRTAADEHVVADRAVVNDRSMPDRALHTDDGRTIGLRVHDDVVLHARARADTDRGHIPSERGVVPDRSARLDGYVADQARGGRDPRVRRDGRALSAIWIERHARMVCAPSSSVPSDRESKGGVQRPIRVLLAKVVLDQEASADELVGTVRALVEARRAAGADR